MKLFDGDRYIEMIHGSHNLHKNKYHIYIYMRYHTTLKSSESRK